MPSDVTILWLWFVWLVRSCGVVPSMLVTFELQKTAVNRGRTDRICWTHDLWPWPAIRCELWLWPTHVQKFKVNNHSDGGNCITGTSLSNAVGHDNNIVRLTCPLAASGYWYERISHTGVKYDKILSTRFWVLVANLNTNNHIT